MRNKILSFYWLKAKILNKAILLLCFLPFISFNLTAQIEKTEKSSSSNINYNAKPSETKRSKQQLSDFSDWKDEVKAFTNSFSDSLRLPIPILYSVDNYSLGENLLREKLAFVYKSQRDAKQNEEVVYQDAVEKIRMEYGFALNERQFLKADNGEFDFLIEYQKNKDFHILIDFPFNAPKRFKDQELEDVNKATAKFRMDFLLYRYFYPELFEKLPQAIKTLVEEGKFQDLMIHSVYNYSKLLENN